MNTEEEAKAYEMALEAARKELGVDREECEVVQQVLCNIFPELAESENEMIRKWILEKVQGYASSGIPCSDEIKMADKAIDYLEKQKEKEKYDRMQPVYDNLDSFESALAKAWKAYNDSGSRTVDGCEDDYVECAHAKGFREGYLFGLEKQKEQKWSPSEGEMGVLYKLCYLSNQITDEDDTELTRLYQDLKREYFNGHSFENMFPSEKQKEHQSCPDAPKEKSVGGNFYSSDKDKNLDEIAQDYVDGVKEYNPEPTWDLMQTAVCYGYHLSEEQFEKNRLANCDAVSKEECDRETDFAMEIIEKEHRHPTFNDAINYGMRLQKQKEQKHPNGCFTCDEYKKGYEEGRRNGFTAGYNKAMKEVEQKEQKPLTTEETELNSIAFLEQVGYTCIPPRKEQKPAQTAEEKEYVRTLKGLISDFIRDCGGCTIDTEYYQKICNWLDGRHIEQKQVEKQDYSGLNDLERAILRGFLLAGVENVPVTIIKETAKECLAQMNPAEWSEDIIRKAVKEVGLTQHQIDWFKANVFPPKQELSDEDDWKRKELIQYLEEKGDYRTVWMTWLKSLRPSWKPSEEQKEALEYVIRDYREDCCNATANYLQEVLDHLKNM